MFQLYFIRQCWNWSHDHIITPVWCETLCILLIIIFHVCFIFKKVCSHTCISLWTFSKHWILEITVRLFILVFLFNIYIDDLYISTPSYPLYPIMWLMYRGLEVIIILENNIEFTGKCLLGAEFSFPIKEKLHQCNILKKAIRQRPIYKHADIYDTNLKRWHCK